MPLNAALARPFHPVARPAPVARPPSPLDFAGPVTAYARDQEVFGQGEPALNVYRVLSGAVRCFQLLSDGRRQISDFYLPGDVFGVEAGAEHRVSAEAMGETLLVVARRSTLMDGREATPERANAMWRLAIGQLQRSNDHALTLGRRSAVERVASLLVDLADRLDVDETVNLPMTRQDMADYLGLTIETVSRTLTQMQATGLIRVSGCRAIQFLDRDALEALCE
jgi:CRP/FNR family nitrogen fixation transcriptional regulator